MLLTIMAAFASCYPCLRTLAVDKVNGNYPCDKCNKPFNDIILWNAHEETCISSAFTEDADNMEDIDVPFQCDACGKKLPNINRWMNTTRHY